MTDSDTIDEAVRRADQLEDEGDLDTAITVLSKEIKASPTAARLYARRGRLRYLSKAYHEAIADFDVAITLRPSAATTFYFRARAKSFLNDLDGALADFEACVSLQPNSPDALFEMGLIHEYRRRFNDALALYERAKAIAPAGNKYPAPEALDDRILDLRRRLADTPDQTNES